MTITVSRSFSHVSFLFLRLVSLFFYSYSSCMFKCSLWTQVLQSTQKKEKRVSHRNNKNNNNNNGNNKNNNNVQVYYAAAAAASTKSPKRFVWKVNRTEGELRG